MMKFEVISKYEGILNESHLPRRGTDKSAGYDVKSAEDMVIESHLFKIMSVMQGLQHPQKPLTLEEIKPKLKELGIKPVLVPTGVKLHIPSNMYGSLDNRSSVPLNSLLMVANGRGIIDADYINSDNEGHIHVMFINLSPFPIQIKRGDKIAQLIIEDYKTVNDDKPVKSERTGGFGHTGVK